ncbi:MAG: type 4a pilus biogenesis protein PilO [Desulfobacteraceae bacterium]|nr:type 4a pilus biogenesis protein PilO [Desulfobacteraceae bacterium]
MKSEAKTTNRTIGLKESLGPFRKLHILYACCVLSGLIILIFAYRPLMNKLHDAANRLNEVETKLLNQRGAIAASENSDVKGRIMQRNEVPLAIAELTEKGRELGLNFSSISPRELQETTQASVRKLPINFTIESEYKDIGQFLAYVEGFSRSIVEIESLSIRPRENNLPKLSVELALNLYVVIANATQ